MTLDQETNTTLAVIRRMEEAINRRDVDAFMACCTDDIVWETTTPPDGDRFEGQVAVRAAVEDFLRGSRDPVFETEDLIALGDHGFLRWRYEWKNADGTAGHVRGVDLIRLRDGKIAEMLAYVKG
jgi:ketosteroid isomerase-like protein